MSEPLVSIIVPVYNGRTFIDRFMQMILSQTYLRIELVLVDDGSEDDSLVSAEKYRPAFREKGYVLRCFRQDHQGQAAAVNRGLREYSGEYLKWMDCDDLLEPECIQEELTYLLEHPECGFVICDSRYVQEGSMETLRVFGRSAAGEDDYFREILRGTHNYSLGSGTILISRENLQKAIPQMQICESPEGQNYQLMLPITYHLKCGYLHKPLFIRTVREDSHSRKARTYEEQKERRHNFIILMEETIRRMQIPEEAECAALAEKRFGHLLYQEAFRNRDLDELEESRKLLRKNRDLTWKEALKYYVANNNVLYWLWQRKAGRNAVR